MVMIIPMIRYSFQSKICVISVRIFGSTGSNPMSCFGTAVAVYMQLMCWYILRMTEQLCSIIGCKLPRKTGISTEYFTLLIQSSFNTILPLSQINKYHFPSIKSSSNMKLQRHDKNYSHFRIGTQNVNTTFRDLLYFKRKMNFILIETHFALE